VIGKGRLIADTSVDEFVRSSSLDAAGPPGRVMAARVVTDYEDLRDAV